MAAMRPGPWQMRHCSAPPMDSTVARWAQAIKAENPDTGEFRDRAGKLDLAAIVGANAASGSGGDPKDSTAFNFGYLLGIAFFIFLVYRFLNRHRA